MGVALHPIDPLSQVDWSQPLSFILVLPYFPMTELLQMSLDSLPCPPQMRNGGLLLAHLSLSLDTLINPSGWLKIKWSQPPPRTPQWVIISWYIPPSNACTSCNDKDWYDCIWCKDHQAVGLPPLPPLLGGDNSYQGSCSHQLPVSVMEGGHGQTVGGQLPALSSSRPLMPH